MEESASCEEVGLRNGLRKGSVRAAVYQSPYLAGLPRQEDYSLHAVCRKDTIQGFGFGEDATGELQR